MALYRCSIKNFSRADGHTATAAAAYRAGVDIKDSRTGEHHRYAHRTRDHEVLHAAILAPPGSPDWVNDRETMWNKNEHRADQSTRPNQARVAREFLLALPHECSAPQQIQMAEDFAQEELVAKGIIVDIAIHAPNPESDQRNYHAHLLCPNRTIDETGEFGKTNREWNQTKFLEHIRLAWEHKVNHWLERIGSKERVDSRSLKDQGLDRLPTQHMGKAAWQMEKTNKNESQDTQPITRIGKENRDIEEWNSLQKEAEDYQLTKEKLLAQKQKILEDINVIDLEIEREKRRKGTGSQGVGPLPAQAQQRLERQQLDERRTLEDDIAMRRSLLSDTIDRYYDVKRLQEDLVQARNDLKKAQTPMGRLLGREHEENGRIKALRLNLRDAERRLKEQLDGFDAKAAKELKDLTKRQKREMEQLRKARPPEHEAETDEFRDYAPGMEQPPYPRAVNDNETRPERDPDPGYGPSHDR